MTLATLVQVTALTTLLAAGSLSTAGTLLMGRVRNAVQSPGSIKSVRTSPPLRPAGSFSS